MRAVHLPHVDNARLSSVGFFLLAGLVYALIAGRLLQHPSVAPYFVDLADAFLNGRLDIEQPGNDGYDMIYFNDQWFVAQPPLPALVALPFVAALGADSTSDVVIAVLCGAASVALCGPALRRSSPDLSVSRWISLVLLYAFGTVLVSLSVLGTIWYLGQVVAAACLWVLILCVLARKPLLTGLAAGLLLLSRPSVIPACVVFALGYWFLDSGRDWPSLRRPALWFFAGLIPAVLLMGSYNMARFGSALDSGYDYIIESDFALQRRQSLGVFSLAFLPENYYVAFLKPLRLAPQCLSDSDCPVIETDLKGAGLLWTSPAILLYAFAARSRSRTETNRYGLFAIAALLALAPSLLYHNTGEAQFGYRFALDALPFAMLLVAGGARRGPLWLLWLLVAVSIAINIWGAIWLMHMLV